MAEEWWKSDPLVEQKQPSEAEWWKSDPLVEQKQPPEAEWWKSSPIVQQNPEPTPGAQGSAEMILICLFVLFLGYWVISKSIAGKKVEADKFKQRKEKNEFKHEYESEKSDYKEWYVVLGVSRTASMVEIQAAYKSLIRQYHPDKVASLGEELRNLAEQKSKAINVAYKQAQDLRGGGS